MRYLFRLLLTASIVGALVLLVGYTVFVDDGLALVWQEWPIAGTLRPPSSPITSGEGVAYLTVDRVRVHHSRRTASGGGPVTRRIYNGSWPRVRLARLEYDNWLCQIHGPHCKVKATEVDHIISEVEGGSWRDPDNLRSVCRPCHNGRKSRRLVIVNKTQSQPSREW